MPQTHQQFKGVASHSKIMSEKVNLLGNTRTYTVNSAGSKAFRAAAYVGGGVKSVLGLQKPKDGEKGEFTSSLGVMLSMLGCVVGTGNIWRFPRIMALHAEEGGALVFLIVWFMFLLLWSIPICLIEYGVGRYTKSSVVESFGKVLGPSYRWMGGFIAVLTLGIGSYYSVLLGYCGYYMFLFMVKPLPDNLEVAQTEFDKMQNGEFPIILHIIMVCIACLCISRGVSTIEPANRIIVPTLLFIVVFTFYWALYLPYAGMGIIHMFSPNWKSFGDADLWRNALTQNAWDTGAGGGLFLTYATYMRRNQGAVKLGSTTPLINNIVSLICGMTIFCSVFSSEYLKGSDITTIIDVLKTNGPFNTGITFIQMPLLYNSLTGGRVLAVLFFICITLAGLSSLISILELCVHVFEDFGIRRIPGTLIVFVLATALGLGSALDTDIFVNQDATWAQALILSGCFLIFLVLRFGILRFRREFFNQYGIGDWPLPWVWVVIILVIAPIEGIGMLLWWFIDEIINNSDPYVPNSPWWQYTPTSLIMILTQWILVIAIMVGLNWWLSPITRTDNLALKSGRPTKISRLRSSLVHFFIIHKTVHEIPPGSDDDDIDHHTPISSTKALHDDDEEYQLTGKGLEIKKSHTASVIDEKL